MVEIERPKVSCIFESENGREAHFVVEPLEKGLGTTIGTSLRRILLSQIGGAAATSIQIDGVRHEFSTIPGVVEDVTEIVLNLKSVNFKLHTDSTTVVIDHNGSGVITAGDIKCNSDVEVLNPEQHIATANDDAKVHIDITVKKGKGWKIADKNKAAGQPLGTIPIDSIYSPVTRVNATVENTLVGNSTDYEKLTLEIVTNGAISPADALKEAASTLIKKFKIFTDGAEDVDTDDEQIEAEESGDVLSKELLNTAIEDLELSQRSLRALKRANVNTIGELIEIDPTEIMKLRNVGKKSFDDIRQKVQSMGISYGEDVDVNE